MINAQPQAVPELSDQPFFIIGSPRSGTTLLERILNRHSRLFIPPETEFFYRLMLQGLLGKPFDAGQASRFLDSYLECRPATLLGLARTPELKRRLLEDADDYGTLFLRLMDVLRGSCQKPRCGEKTPHHLQSATTILELFPKASMIAMVRDERAVTRNRLQKPGWEDNLFSAARLWKRDSEKLVKLLQSHGDRCILVVRYEELVTDTSRVVGQVCEFLGEAFQPEMLNPEADEGSRFDNYYQQSWMAKASRPIDAKSVDAWRSAFLPKELALINHLQGPNLRYWGYPVETQGATGGWRMLLLKERLRHAVYRVKRKLAGATPLSRSGS